MAIKSISIANTIPELVSKVQEIIDQLNVGSVDHANTATEANNALHLGGELPSYYRDASNIDAGTLAPARLPIANTTANGAVSTTTQSFTGVKTFVANTVVGANTLYVNVSSGRVGVKRAPTSYDLDVNGSINFTGTLYNNGTAFSQFAAYAAIPHLTKEGTFSPKSIDGVYADSSVIAGPYEAPALTWAIVRSFRVVNQSTSTSYWATIYRVPAGNAANTSHVIMTANLICGETIVLPGPIVLEPGDVIGFTGQSNNVISLRGDIVEFTAMPTGVTIKAIDGITSIFDNWATVYTCPASTRAVIDWFSVVNNSTTTARKCTAAIRPSSGYVSNRECFVDLGWFGGVNSQLQPRETAIIATLDNPIVLEEGEVLRIYSDSVDLAFNGSVREYAI